MVKRHQQTRKLLMQKQSKRQNQEMKKRQARIKKGFRSVWGRLTGKHAQAQKQNEIEAYKSLRRDQTERDTLIFNQLEERCTLQHKFDTLNTEQQEEISTIKEAILSKLPEEKITLLRQKFEHSAPKAQQNNDLSL